MSSRIHIDKGKVICVYDDRFLPLFEALGVPQIDRASTVEYDPIDKVWEAELVGGLVIARGQNRNEVITQEVKWLEDNLESHRNNRR